MFAGTRRPVVRLMDRFQLWPTSVLFRARPRRTAERRNGHTLHTICSPAAGGANAKFATYLGEYLGVTRSQLWRFATLSPLAGRHSADRTLLPLPADVKSRESMSISMSMSVGRQQHRARTGNGANGSSNNNTRRTGRSLAGYLCAVRRGWHKSDRQKKLGLAAGRPLSPAPADRNIIAGRPPLRAALLSGCWRRRCLWFVCLASSDHKAGLWLWLWLYLCSCSRRRRRHVRSGRPAAILLRRRRSGA